MSRGLTGAQRAQSESLLPTVARTASQLAKRYPSVTREDLEAVGREALVVATSRHDPSIGPLEPFAFSYVRGEMLNHARKTLRTFERENRLPCALLPGHSTDERSAAERLEAALSATDDDDRADIVREMRQRIAGCLAELRSTPLEQDDAEKAHLDWRAMALGRRVLEETVATLDEPDRTVYQRFYREERTLDAIAAELGLSKRTVQRIDDRLRAAIDQAIQESGVG